MSNFKPPTTDSTSFHCPRCGALAQQFWYEVMGYELKSDQTPRWPREDLEEALNSPNAAGSLDPDKKTEILEWAKRLRSEDVFLHELRDCYKLPVIQNLHISRCYNCNDVSVWIGKKLAYPMVSTEFQASIDMPETVRRDFDEAARVFHVSPRASAALLRVAIEKLCNEINGRKLSVFKGIGELVDKGLDIRIQKALDIVRVTGNDAVHPGQIDLNDTPEDAERLFKLVNIIVEKLITLPREIDSVYDGISIEKRDAINARDGKKGKPE